MNQGEYLLVIFLMSTRDKKVKRLGHPNIKDLRDFEIQDSMDNIKVFKEEAWKTFINQKKKKHN